jgi:signal peptidase I
MRRKDNNGALKELGFSLLAEGKSLRVRADGYSMYPFIKPGSVITVEPYGKEEMPAEGEIIAWKREQTLIVHRLIHISKQGTEFTSRGDSCRYADRPLLREQIAGRVICVEDTAGNPRTGRELVRKPCYLYNRALVILITLAIRIRRKLKKLR